MAIYHTFSFESLCYYSGVNPDSLLAKHFRLDEAHKKALAKLRIETVSDLLHHFPVRYGDTATIEHIQSAETGKVTALYGKITGLKTKKSFKSKVPMAEATLTDETGTVKLVWFHQAYLAKMLREGSLVRVEGKMTEKNGMRSIVSPKIETVDTIPLGVGDSLFGTEGIESTLYPVYNESKGITSNWIFHTIQKIFGSGILDTLIDPIPEEILSKYNLPKLQTALVWIHRPKKEADSQSARKRFAFEEIFMIQLEKAQTRHERESHGAFQIDKSFLDIAEFTKKFPFPLTNAQTRAIDSMFADFKKPYPMSRLLEGDVGSGKTAVAAAIAYAVGMSNPIGQNFGNLQVAYMAPTEILAQQHFESFIKYFEGSGMQIALITGSGCQKFPSKINPKGTTPISRSQLLKWVANGEIPILIGTHALIQKSVRFKHLGLVIIDEQHRFGTEQRRKLREKEDRIPHLLSMTATPIPRTLALTLYGDLDLSLLDELPPGRKPVETKIITPEKRKDVYEQIRAELKLGRQAYVICPRINEPDPDLESAIITKSVTEETKRLQKEVFPEFSVGMIHGKMSPKEKDKVMTEFTKGSIHILVATSVIEVGVNVPNATMIIIEGAERFGLAQLHQLRGRVMRSSFTPLCFIFAETKSANSLERLKALTSAANGFDLAEFDLKQRGAGQLGGGKQWGISDLGMEAIQNIKMVEAARTSAQTIIESDPSLSHFPILRDAQNKRTKKIHFE